MTPSQKPEAQPSSRRVPYLFLLTRPSVDERRRVAAQVREQDIPVVAQYGAVAIEVSATREEADRVSAIGEFSARLSRAASTETLGKLSPEQREVVEQWNTRFSEDYRAIARARKHAGRSWGAGGDLAAPAPYTEIDPEDLRALLRLHEVPQPGPVAADRTAARPLQGEDFTRFERRLAERYDDERLAYHLSRAAWRLGPAYYELVERLPDAVLRELRERFSGSGPGSGSGSGAGAGSECRRMTGEISVGIVFVESSKAGGPKFGAAKRNQIRQEVLDGQAWLAGQHPTGNLSWVYHFQNVSIDVANGSGDPGEAYWRNPAMAKVTFDGNTYAGEWDSVAAYREHMRAKNGSAHAIVVFVTPYANSWHAYAGGGRVTLASKNDWGGWGQATLDAITAHETAHLFGASDEYSGSGTPCSSCSTTHGCDQIRNGNCAACSHPHQACVMDANTLRLCPWTRAHIGWGHLFVELTTASDTFSGTDDTVRLDIGDKTFVLDTPGHDDRETGNVDGYPLFQPSLTKADIKRVLIRKSADGGSGGWKLKRVRVFLRGELVCDRNNINQWLEDDRLWWLGCATDGTLVNQLRVEVSTADVAWAGTDDDVSVTLAGRTWNLDNDGQNDFERGHTDGFELDPGTGLKASQFTAVKIHKSPDGVAGGWKLKGVRVFVNGSQVFSNQSINKWLEDNHRDWSSSF